MFLIDTHTHLYLDDFNKDRGQTIRRAIDSGVKIMLLPNIDSSSVDPMLKLQSEFPDHCFAMMGLHPTSVKENWEEELRRVENNLANGGYCSIGEVGLDFYWDTTFRLEQELVFRRQVELAAEYQLPLVIHSRKALDEIITIIRQMKISGLRGVFHCFPGSAEQAVKVVEMWFYLGIGGVVTYKNSSLASIVHQVGLEHVVLETDAPFITPAPFRGKRNESAYITIIASSLAGHLNITEEEVANITTRNALQLFDRLPQTTHKN